MSLERLLRPRSIAIVGASDKVGPGFNAVKALEFVGFDGAVHLVNPNRPELLGRKTFRTLAEVPGPIDAVFVAISHELVLDVVKQAAAKKAGGLAILSSGFGESDESGIAAQRELAQIAAAHDLAVCGPNCLGFLNFAGRTALFGTSLPERADRGGIAAILQSGSVGIALLNAARGLGLSHLITSGNEAVTTTPDYMEALIEDPDVKVIVTFLEQLRKPRKFIEVARRARALGKPVIVLKTGRGERSREAAMAHTGAVAGSDEVCDAAFRAAGVMRVDSLDEMLEAAMLASAIARPPRGDGVAVMSLSGGEIGLALDVVDAAGIKLAPIAAARAEIASLLPEFAHISNPLDLTWAGLYDASVSRRIAHAWGSQDDVGLLVLLQDAPSGLGMQQATRYSNLLKAVAEGAHEVNVPLVAVSNLAGEPHPTFACVARQHMVPCLRGTQEGFTAIGQFTRWAAQPPRDADRIEKGEPARQAAARLDALGGARLPAEHEARGILAAYGVTGPRERMARNAEEAMAAASEIGFPVVLKGVVENLLHKSDVGLVKVDLRSADEVREAAAAMLERARGLGRTEGLLVQQMLSPVAEILVGARVDAEFGPIIVVGAGGVLVELYKDVSIRLAPVDEATAREMIAETRASKLLAGWRGKPEGDVAAAAKIVAALSRFIAEFVDRVAEVEINPLAVFADGKGCSALDCLIVPQDWKKR
jgi:acyl-CoA synthetase (NDP forming)